MVIIIGCLTPDHVNTIDLRPGGPKSYSSPPQLSRKQRLTATKGKGRQSLFAANSTILAFGQTHDIISRSLLLIDSAMVYAHQHEIATVVTA